MSFDRHTLKVSLWTMVLRLTRAENKIQLFGIFSIIINISIVYYNVNREYFILVSNVHPRSGLISFAAVPLLGMAALAFIYFMTRASTNTLLINVSLLINAFGLIVLMIIQYAQIYVTTGLIDMDHHVIHDPASCLYFSIVTWTTVGYGDLVPSLNARFVAASEGFVSYFAFAFILATAARIAGAPFRRFAI